MKRGRLLLGVLGMALAVIVGSIPLTAHADTATPSDFNLQVTPSPLVTTAKPGSISQLELKIHNNGSGTETLKIEPRTFSYSSTNGRINLDDATPPPIASWISFSQPKFTIASGQWVTEQININAPKDSGFSYAFALLISRQSNPKPVGGTQSLAGSLAVFTLINVDRPGAKSSLEVVGFNTSKHIYEYLPATFTIRFRNNGNTIVQPYGNVFIQRSTNNKIPLATLAVNETKGYTLPGTERTISASWNDGFPVYQPRQNPDGTVTQKLVWDWAKLSQLRIGYYTAHLVAVYNQAGRDVPIEGTVSFWVIPWKILLGLFTVALLILFALFIIVRGIIRGIKRRHQKRAQRKAAKAQTPSAASDTDKDA